MNIYIRSYDKPDSPDSPDSPDNPDNPVLGLDNSHIQLWKHGIRYRDLIHEAPMNGNPNNPDNPNSPSNPNSPDSSSNRDNRDNRDIM